MMGNCPKISLWSRRKCYQNVHLTFECMFHSHKQECSLVWCLYEWCDISDEDNPDLPGPKVTTIWYISMIKCNMTSLLLPQKQISKIAKKSNALSITHLTHDNLDIIDRNPLIVWPNNQFEQVMSEHLEHHANMSAVCAFNFEVVKKLHNGMTSSVSLITLSNTSQ